MPRAQSELTPGNTIDLKSEAISERDMPATAGKESGFEKQLSNADARVEVVQ